MIKAPVDNQRNFVQFNSKMMIKGELVQIIGFAHGLNRTKFLWSSRRAFIIGLAIFLARNIVSKSYKSDTAMQLC